MKKETKTATKKAPVKRISKTVAIKNKKPSTKASSSPIRINFAPQDRPFLTFRVTRESIYWGVLGAIVIVYSLWLFQLQSEIDKIYDSIEVSVSAL